MSTKFIRLWFLAFVLLTSNIAQAASILYVTNLDGSSSFPPNASSGTGTGLVTYDSIAHTLLVDIKFSGLTAPITAAHFQCCTSMPGTGAAAVASTTPSFLGFPTGVTSGTYLHLLDLTLNTSWNPGFINANGGSTAGAEASFIAGIDAGKAYLNLHTTVFPGGEIRGFLHQADVPEPNTVVLLGIGVIALAMNGRRKVVWSGLIGWVYPRV